MVTRIKFDDRHAEPVLEVRLNDRTLWSLVLRWTPGREGILGSLILVAKDDQLLLHPKHGEIAFHSMTQLSDKPVAGPRALTLSQRIESAIETIARQAWQGIPVQTEGMEGLKLAKQEALRLIGRLSPLIKRQVEHHFTSQKWKPLIDQRPQKGL